VQNLVAFESKSSLLILNLGKSIQIDTDRRGLHVKVISDPFEPKLNGNTKR